jgi:hypothetical protein
MAALDPRQLALEEAFASMMASPAPLARPPHAVTSPPALHNASATVGTAAAGKGASQNSAPTLANSPVASISPHSSLSSAPIPAAAPPAPPSASSSSSSSVSPATTLTPPFVPPSREDPVINRILRIRLVSVQNLHLPEPLLMQVLSSGASIYGVVQASTGLPAMTSVAQLSPSCSFRDELFSGSWATTPTHTPPRGHHLRSSGGASAFGGYSSPLRTSSPMRTSMSSIASGPVSGAPPPVVAPSGQVQLDVTADSPSSSIRLTVALWVRPLLVEDPDSNAICIGSISLSLPLSSSALIRHSPMVCSGELTLETELLLPGKPQVSQEDFDLIRVLGRGSFGKVLLVRKRDSQLCYALKVRPFCSDSCILHARLASTISALLCAVSLVIAGLPCWQVLRKVQLFEAKAVHHAVTERRVLERLQHPFIVALRFSFQTPAKLYLVLDYACGGELFFHLGRVERFGEATCLYAPLQLVRGR